MSDYARCWCCCCCLCSKIEHLWLQMQNIECLTFAVARCSIDGHFLGGGTEIRASIRLNDVLGKLECCTLRSNALFGSLVFSFTCFSNHPKIQLDATQHRLEILSMQCRVWQVLLLYLRLHLLVLPEQNALIPTVRDIHTHHTHTHTSTPANSLIRLQQWFCKIEFSQTEHKNERALSS